MNSWVSDTNKKYKDWKEWDAKYATKPEDAGDAYKPDKVKKMREDMDFGIVMRNTMYVLAGVGLAGFAVTFFF
jgi:hypothetical protein